ncbi:hypothetical protein [Halomontanus rarus]|uniref:hypothetical protein n=1 Tax=Halomontanus rarus TaxID=3034020 RepID=UPI001A98CD76
MSDHNQRPAKRWLEAHGINRRDFVKAGSTTALLGLLGSTQAAAQSDTEDIPNWKTRPTVWTEEDRANARQNVEKFDWAKAHRDQVVRNADLILDAYDLEGLWRLVPGPTLPRSTSPPDSPAIDGYEHTFGNFHYAPHPDYHWKTVVEGTDGEEYRLPSNDFAAYRESGRDDRGFFDAELADDDLLVNEEYPDLPDDWGVDDGSGFVDDEGVLGSEGAWYNPISQYNYWRAIYGVRQMLMELGHAYMFTEERRYARAGAVMLDRIADVYPEGTLTWNRIFEASSIRAILRSYDAVFPGMDGDDELVAFLDGKTEEFPELGRKDSIGQIRRNIEAGLIHRILPYVRDYEIRGNFGMHQAALAVSAVVADDPEGYTAETIDFTFRPGTLTGDGRVTGGDIFGFLVGSPQSGYMVDEEGYPSESSVHYNTTQQSSLEEALSVLRGYDGYEGADLYRNPKFKGMLDSHWQLTFGQYIPQIANTHGVGNPKAVAGATPKNDRVIQDPDFALTGFDEYGKPELAQWAYMLNGLTTDGLEMGIFHPKPEGIREDVEAVIEERGAYPISTSNQQPAYGFTALRDGEYGWDGSSDPGSVTYDFVDLAYEASTDVTEFGTPAYQLEAQEEGEWIEFECEVPTTGEYEVTMDLGTAPSYGIYEAFVGGESVGTRDLYDEEGTAHRTIEATLDLEEGTTTLRFENAGKHEDATNYKAVFYDVRLRERTDESTTDATTARGVYQYYGRNFWDYDAGLGVGSAHVHMDTHNLGVYGYDLDLSPELGRQGSDHEGNYLGSWVESTPAHNTVTVDEENINSPQWVGYPRHFDHTDRVQLMDVESRHCYEQADEYRRTTTMVNVDETHSYVADFFRVSGGDDHHFSFHATTCRDVETDGLDLEPQDGGTYEGEDVDFSEGGLFSHLYDVERDESPAPGFAVDWDVEDYWEVREDDGEPVHLRLTMFDEVDDVALATSRPAEQDEENNPEELPFLLAHREGDDLSSTFTSIVEPYEGDRVVESAELVDAEGEDPDAVRALKVELVDGRTDYVVSSTDADGEYVIDDRFEFSGAFGVYALRDGETEFVYANDATLFRAKGGGRPSIQNNRPGFEGTVEDFTRELSMENELEVKLTGTPRDADIEEMVGGWIYVEPADPDPIPEGVQVDERYDNESRDRRNGAFPIEGVERGRGNRVTIDVGEHTPVRRYYTNDPEDGYSYSIEEGAEFTVPRGETWERE